MLHKRLPVDINLSFTRSNINLCLDHTSQHKADTEISDYILAKSDRLKRGITHKAFHFPFS